MTLDTFITAAHARQTERDATAAATAAAETERRRQALIDQLRREVTRAFPADLVATLDLTYGTQDVYPQSFASFSYRGETFRLSYGEQRESREWQITRVGSNERSTSGRGVQESKYDRALFVDALLLAIAELSLRPSIDNY